MMLPDKSHDTVNGASHGSAQVEPVSLRLHLSDCAQVSSHLPTLVVEVRQFDRALDPHLRMVWAVGLLLAGFEGFCGNQQAGIILASVALVGVLSGWGFTRWVGVPAGVRPLIALARQNPTGETVGQVALAFDKLGNDGGRVAYLARALQWRALQHQISPEDPRVLKQLGNTASALAKALSIRPDFFKPETAQRALRVAHDAQRRAA